MIELVPSEFEKSLTDDKRSEYYFMIMEEMEKTTERMEDLEALLEGTTVVRYEIVKNFDCRNFLIKGQMYLDDDIDEVVTEVVELHELSVDEYCELYNKLMP